MKNLFLIITIVFGSLLLGPALLYADQVDNNRLILASADQLPENEGIVLSILDTTGYTYMELENGGKRFWIAAPTTQVKAGDHIRFTESMTMHNFTSKSLNRTFNRLIFVTSTKVKVAQ